MTPKTRFKPDSAETRADKNRALAAQLAGPWLNLNIIKIERKKSGGREGWLVTYA